MRKILILFAVLCLSSSLFAQLDLGVKIGANYPDRGFEGPAFQEYITDISDPATITGYVGGVFLGMHSDVFGLQLEAMLPVEGFSITRLLDGDPPMDVIGGTSFNTEYINAVLMAKFSIDLALIRPFAGAGLSFGIPLEELMGGESSILIENYDVSRLGFAFSVGVGIFDLLDAEVRYTTGITDIYSGEIDRTHPYFGQLMRLNLAFHIF